MTPEHLIDYISGLQVSLVEMSNVIRHNSKGFEVEWEVAEVTRTIHVLDKALQQLKENI